MKMKGQAMEISVHEKAFILLGAIIVSVIALTVVVFLITPSLANTPQARADLKAHSIALYISSLSAVDEGYIESNLKETCVVEIGKPSAAAKNYYVKVMIYDSKGNLLAESGKVTFVGNMESSCSKTGACMETEKVTFLKFTKEIGKAVKMEGLNIVSSATFTECEYPSKENIEAYVKKYSAQYKVDIPLILAIMSSESKMEHCVTKNNAVVLSCSKSNPPSCGLMQIWQGHITESKTKPLEKIGIYDIEDLADAEKNINAGVLIISDALKRFPGYTDQKKLAVANYNCGGIYTAAEKYCADNKKTCWETIKPHIGKSSKEADKYCDLSDETLPYVERVMRFYSCFSKCLEDRDGSSICYDFDVCKSEWKA